MSTRGRRVVALVLGVLALAALMLVLVPVGISGVVHRPVDDVLDVLHGLGLPRRVNGHVAEFGANVALFAVLVFLVALLVPRRRWWWVVGGAFVVALAVETAQAAGIPHRVGSVRDVLGNTLGALLGVAGAAVADGWLRRRAARRAGARLTGPA